MQAFVDALRTAAEAAALPLVGAVAVAAYDDEVPLQARLRARHPWARSAVVLGQGGGAFWERFRDARRADPHLETLPDPLDAWTRTVVAAVVAAAQVVRPLPCRILASSDVAVDFRRLAVLAGLGVPSRLGILIHPRFGPWVALRGAVLLPVEVAPAEPLTGVFAPCQTCPDHPCEPACPVGAVSAHGWNVPACAHERLRPDESCGRGCHARLACPVGSEHRYPDDALRFHQGAARRLMQTMVR